MSFTTTMTDCHDACNFSEPTIFPWLSGPSDSLVTSDVSEVDVRWVFIIPVGQSVALPWPSKRINYTKLRVVRLESWGEEGKKLGVGHSADYTQWDTRWWRPKADRYLIPLDMAVAMVYRRISSPNRRGPLPSTISSSTFLPQYWPTAQWYPTSAGVQEPHRLEIQSYWTRAPSWAPSTPVQSRRSGVEASFRPSAGWKAWYPPKYQLVTDESLMWE